MKKNARRNRKMRKVLMMVCCMALLVGISIGGTVAWLSASTGEVKNTFTVGDINITLDEADTDDSDKDGSTTDRDTANSYKVIPGQTIAKDPTVHVLPGSENCYVFVKVTNTMVLNNTVVATPNIVDTDWEKVGTVTDGAVYVYTGSVANEKVVAPAAANLNLTVFTQVKIADTVTKADIDDLANKTITIEAYAHQAAEAGYDTALAAALAHFGATAVSGN